MTNTCKQSPPSLLTQPLSSTLQQLPVTPQQLSSTPLQISQDIGLEQRCALNSTGAGPSGLLSKTVYCKCNGGNARCKNCACVKLKKRCTNCHPGKTGGCHNSFEQSARFPRSRSRQHLLQSSQPSSQQHLLQSSQPSSQLPSLDLSSLEPLSPPPPTASQQSLLESPPSQEVQHSSDSLIPSQQLSSPPASSSVCLTRKQCPVPECTERIAPTIICPYMPVEFFVVLYPFLGWQHKMCLSVHIVLIWLLIQGQTPTHNIAPLV